MAMTVIILTVAEIGVLTTMAAGLIRKRSLVRPARVGHRRH